MVCNFNFERVFGEIGKEFLQVHYEIEINTIGEENEINPITDLKPICPNCHAMLHKRNPAYSVRKRVFIILTCFKKLTI